MSTLQNEIRSAREKKEILLMTHLVLGYPSLEVNREVVEEMVEGGVDLIELQIPFSEPVADGPVISRACQDAIAAGITVRECLDFAACLTADFDGDLDVDQEDYGLFQRCISGVNVAVDPACWQQP